MVFKDESFQVVTDVFTVFIYNYTQSCGTSHNITKY